MDCLQWTATAIARATRTLIRIRVFHSHLLTRFCTSIHELVHSDEVKGIILKELNSTGKKAGFSGIQMLGDVVLTDEEWTPENGFTTAAQKINRKKIRETFSKEIESSSAKA